MDRFRRQFLTSLPGSLSAMILASADVADDICEAVIAPTSHGRIQGRRLRGIAVFKGVPYAGRVSAERRFLPPAPLASWPGVRSALRPGPPAIQHVSPGIKLAATQNEDCLVLNIWTPEVGTRRRRPVMVYCHGGGFSAGSGSGVDGLELARTQDVVVVTTNHRLGLFGFLSLADLAGGEYASSGANGLLDIVAALDWIRRNIEGFGGDPERVMLFGESGGGGKVAGLCAMPDAKDRFHRSSIESVPAARLTRREDAAEMTRRYLHALGIAPGAWKKLLAMPAGQLLAATVGFNFMPVVDGRFIAQHPFDPVASPLSLNVPLLIGANHDEAIWFMQGRDADGRLLDPGIFRLSEEELKVRLAQRFGDRGGELLRAYRASRPGATPTDLLVAIQTADMVWNPMDIMAERKAEAGGAPVFRYLFTYQSEAPVEGSDYPKRAMHAMEIDFKFNMVENHAERVGRRPERHLAARNMSGMWAAFARTGDPSIGGQPQWHPSAPGERATMLIDAACTMTQDPYRLERLAWQRP